MQCLSIFPIILCVFTSAACLTLSGTEYALLVSKVVMLSSHNVATSLCCYDVDHFIPVVVILRYDYKPTLNIIVRKLYVVGTSKP